jgi:hypothetical protein
LSGIPRKRESGRRQPPVILANARIQDTTQGSG